MAGEGAGERAEEGCSQRRGRQRLQRTPAVGGAAAPAADDLQCDAGDEEDDERARQDAEVGETVDGLIFGGALDRLVTAVRHLARRGRRPHGSLLTSSWWNR